MKLLLAVSGCSLLNRLIPLSLEDQEPTWMPSTFPLTQNGSAKISGDIRPGHRQDYRGALSLEFVMKADERS